MAKERIATPDKLLASVGIQTHVGRSTKEVSEFVELLNNNNEGIKWMFVPKTVANLAYDFIAHYNTKEQAWGLLLIGQSGTPYEPADKMLMEYEAAQKEGIPYVVTVPGVAIDSYAKDSIATYLKTQGLFESEEKLLYHQGIALYADAELNETLAINLNVYLSNWAISLNKIQSEELSIPMLMKSFVENNYNFIIYPSFVPGRTMTLATGDKIGVHFSLKLVASSKQVKRFASQESSGSIELVTVSGVIDIVPYVDKDLNAEVLSPELVITSIVSSIPTTHSMILAIRAVQEFASEGFWANTLIEHAATSTASDPFNPGALNRIARRYRRVKEGKKSVLVLEDIPPTLPDVPDLEYPALDLTGAKTAAEKAKAIERLLDLVPGKPKISIDMPALSPDSDPSIVFDVIASDDPEIRERAKEQLELAYADVCGAIPSSSPGAGKLPTHILAIGRNRLPRGYDNAGRSTQDFGLIRIVQAYSSAKADIDALDDLIVNYITARNTPSADLNVDILRTYSMADIYVTGVSNRVLLHGDFVRAIKADLSPIKIFIAGEFQKRKRRRTLGVVASQLGVDDASF